MSGSIRLHPKHGVNPTMPICFWCGGDTGTVALLGASYQGEAPSRMVINAEPCDACRKNFEMGILVIEAVDRHEPNTLQISQGMYATGRYMVLTEKAIRKFVIGEALQDNVLKRRKMCMDREAFQSILPRPEQPA
jgi:hypothetical protein